MAHGFRHAGYLGAGAAAAQRTECNLYLVELANRIAGFKSTHGLHTMSERFELEKLFEAARTDMLTYNDALGYSAGADIPVFIQGKPHMEDSGPTFPDWEQA